VGRPRAYDENTRQALIDATARLLAERGLPGVTTRAVAAEVGATTTAIYVLFGSKDELLRAVYRAGFAGLAAEFAAIEPGAGTPAEELLALGLAYRRSALARPELYHVMFGWPSLDPVPAEDDRTFAMATLERLAAGVGRCQRAGELAGDDPWPITHQLWAVAHGLTTLELRGALGDRDEADVHWLQALAAAYRGYAPA
jgi:AcrR family transcriptional regulator